MSYCLIKDKNNNPDTNGYGAVNKNFLIQQYFISCEEYISFLNSIGASYKYYGLYNTKIQKIISKNRTIFNINNIDPKEPISYIGLTQLKIYCNWLNTKNLKYLFNFPYNIENNSKNEQHMEYWIPSYDEWYKSVYYDPILTKYWAFPNKSDDSNTDNTLSAYGLVHAGLLYYTIIDNDTINTPKNKYMIAGGSKNRNFINAKSGTVYYVSDEYYAGYISARLCKRSDTKKFILKLYDTYGDGWGQNYISINDSSHKPLYDKLFLKDGYGPSTIILEVDKIERNINLRYYKQDNLSYENYYELYDFDSKQLIYKSNIYESPQDNVIIGLLDK